MGTKIYLNGAFSFREDTLENWLEKDPVLEKGEPALIRDKNDFEWLKIGDGVSKFSALPFKTGPEGKRGPQGEKGEKGDTGEPGKDAVCDLSFNPESENAQSGKAVAEAQNFKQLFDPLEITQEAFDEAGEEGIEIITVGSDDIDLALYDEILITLYVPASNDINTANSLLYSRWTEESAFKASGDNHGFLAPQSAAIAKNCELTPNANMFAIKGIWKADAFLYGQVIKNGYRTSIGYAGGVDGWISQSSGFKKSLKKYIHIFGKGSTFKFPVGTKISVYGR